MSRFFLIIYFVVFGYCTAYCQSHGLQFASHEVVPEKRTSLSLTPDKPLCFKNKTELSFDLVFRPNLETYFGYVLRIITVDNQNIDLVYNQKLRMFNFVIGETFAFPFSIDSLELFGHFNNVKIRIDDQKKEIAFFWNGKELTNKKTGFKSALCARIFFGLNDFSGFQTMDIPPMSIRDIRISENGKLVHHYPLAETNGKNANDAVTNRTIEVKNPTWIKPRHQKWEEVLSLTTISTPSVAFSQKDELLYIVGLDSIFTLSLKDLALKGNRLAKSRGFMPPANQSIVSRLDNMLYNFYTDEKIVSRYDSSGKSWNTGFPAVPLTIFWHSNKFISPVDSSLYVVAGYGQLQYKNLIQRYHFSTGKWDSVKPTGDFFMPRYLAALATNQAGDTAFILGGYGSNTGDQTINPKHNYDLLSYSVATRQFKLLIHLREPERPFCFANSMVLEPGTDNYYALTYPNDRFNSGLQLIKGSFHSPEYQSMADSIPYSFYDVESFSDLFYDSSVKKMIAVTIKMEKNNTTKVKVYTLDFPPNPAESDKQTVSTSNKFLWFAIGAGLLAITGFTLMFVLRKNKASEEIKDIPVSPAGVSADLPLTEPDLIGPLEESRDRSAVFLFGPFEAIDKDGQDLTQAFTPLLREIFLLILIYTFKDGKGISQDKLFEIIWDDKSIKDARNNYSVNSLKLKAILEKLGDCHVSRETGKLRIEIENDSVWVDFQHFMDLIHQKKNISKSSVAALTQILQRGIFLGRQNYNWLEDIKSEISGMIIDTLVSYLEKSDIQTEAEFIIKTSNVIFLSDHLNEEALTYKCRSLIALGRHSLAKDTYARFTKEYKENYGQDFDKSFAQVTKQ